MTSEVNISTVLRNGHTKLDRGYATSPQRVVNITEEAIRGELKLMITSSSPGLLDGDCYDVKVEVGDGCDVTLETQSYQRLFRMKHGASQKLNVHVGANSTFCYLPHPLVPHVTASFTANNTILLATSGTLFWGEVITCGRKLTGEQFLFSLLHLTTEVYREGKLVLKEKMFVKPTEHNIEGLGLWEGYTHHASLLMLGDGLDLELLKEQASTLLSSENDLMFGISRTAIPGLVVRLLGFKAEQLHRCLKQLVTLANNTSTTLSSNE